MDFHQLQFEQILKTDLKTAWEFVSAPGNLKLITPEYMDFQITTRSLPEKIYEGMIISYKVRPMFNIPITWVTEITKMREPYFFVDEQRLGPYRFWHHRHFLENCVAGVRMTDIVSYSVRGNILGTIANELFIEKQLKNIFEFRFRRLEEIFGLEIKTRK